MVVTATVLTARNELNEKWKEKGFLVESISRFVIDVILVPKSKSFISLDWSWRLSYSRSELGEGS